MNYLIAMIVLLAGCMPMPHTENMHLYLLDAKTSTGIVHARHNQVLAISMPGAAPGFATSQMAYRLAPLELEYFAAHRWADTPARMLRPLIVQALEPHFNTIAQMPGMLPADLRLDIELIRLQQDFTAKPGRVQVTLRAQLIDMKARRMIASRLFDETENTDSDNAHGGVIAENRALGRILDQLTEFCINASK